MRSRTVSLRDFAFSQSLAFTIRYPFIKTEVYAEDLAYNTVQISGNPLYPLKYILEYFYLKERKASTTSG